MIKHVSLVVAFAAGLFTTATGLAANFGWLENSPVRYFNEQDHEMSRATIKKALDEGQVGEELAWENPETKHRGSVTVLDDYENLGLPCRRIRIHNVAKTLEGNTSYGLCRHEEAGWKLDQ